MQSRSVLLPVRVALVLALTTACVFTPPPPLPGEEESEPSGLGGPLAKGPEGGGDQGGGGSSNAGPPQFRRGQEPPVGMSPSQILAFNAAQGDPVEGFFTLDEALAGIEGEGDLWVDMVTTQGVISCQLFPELTPITVANFVGLARGLRPWYDRDLDEWVREPYFGGTTFHRVIPGFMIQAGDPTGTGRGNPGYVLPDEFHPDLRHDQAGMLSMANKGANTGSAQFFITLAPTEHLDDVHAVFGRCTPDSVAVAEAIASVARDDRDKPREDQLLEELRFERRPASPASPPPGG